MQKWEQGIFHKAHHSRNLGLLSEDEQKKIDNTRLLIAGCGVGSLVALSAARIGFEHFVLVDGDTVELSNINRQGYSSYDVGKFKVNALANQIKRINPLSKIKKYPVFVDLKNAAKFVHKADIVIDSIDPVATSAIIAMHRAAQKEHKTIVQPTDLGWGAMVQIFSPESVTYEKMIGLDPETPVEKIINQEAFEKFIEFMMKVAPEYVQKIAKEVAQGTREHYPQPVSASYTLAAMTVMAAKRLATDEPVIVAPKFISFDPDSVWDPKNQK